MCRVLIADDDPVRLSRIQTQVGEVVPGCEVICRKSFREASTWLDEHGDQPLDLAIADLFLQGEPPDDPGEGAELIRRVRAQFPTCPCILISGYEKDSDLKRQIGRAHV